MPSRNLHILTKPDCSLAHDVIERQRTQAVVDLKVIDLSSGEPDYRLLLEEIFAADSVAVW